MNDQAAVLPAKELMAFRIRFVDPTVAGRSGLLREFDDPARAAACAERMTFDDLPAARNGTAPADELLVVLVPAGSATVIEFQKAAEGWMAPPRARNGNPIAEVVLRSDRILWRPGQAMIQAPPERFDEDLAAVVEFAFYEGHLRRLEREVDDDWPTAEADVPLTHGVTRPDLARWPHVNRMTERVTLRRMRFARLARRLEQASPTLPGPSRRLVAELLSQAEVTDRLAAVDDKLEVYEDLYELANDRLSEFSYFRSECRLEVWIIVILVLEILVMLWEVGLIYSGR